MEAIERIEAMPYAEFKLIQLTHPLHSKHYRLKQPLPVVIEKEQPDVYTGLFLQRTLTRSERTNY